MHSRNTATRWWQSVRPLLHCVYLQYYNSHRLRRPNISYCCSLTLKLWKVNTYCYLLYAFFGVFWQSISFEWRWWRAAGDTLHTSLCCLQELVCFASPRILRPVVLNRTYRHYIKYLMYLMCPKSNQTLNHKIQRTNVWWSDVSIVSVNSPVGKCLPGARLDVWCVVKTVYDVKPQNSH